MNKIIITGDTVSKKNSKQLIHVRGRTLIISSKAYKKWHDRAISQLTEKQAVAGQISGVELIFYPSTRRKFDLSNHTESIMDLLVDAGVIEDDNYSIVPELTIKFGGQDKENPRCEITIYETNSTH